ncbi:hypothetical protein RCL_jg1070.t1 [Rhizophagus clarus]|uniref:Uncharacterized protein n=1 Tax=Rhizophagus clarus TaxID=94130 RepID=A0A8H3MCW7_9GLOM|nr:hypothetical protein RCL_jg1070.t1 [Rhizophagus clarus]
MIPPSCGPMLQEWRTEYSITIITRIGSSTRKSIRRGILYNQTEISRTKMENIGKNQKDRKKSILFLPFL